MGIVQKSGNALHPHACAVGILCSRWECSASGGNNHPSTGHHQFSRSSRRQHIHTPHKEKGKHSRRAGASKGGNQPKGLKDPRHRPIRAVARPCSPSGLMTKARYTPPAYPCLSCPVHSKKTWGKARWETQRVFHGDAQGKGTVGNHGRREADARVIHRLRVSK